MRISEVIKILSDIKDVEGDIHVGILDNEYNRYESFDLVMAKDANSDNGIYDVRLHPRFAAIG